MLSLAGMRIGLLTDWMSLRGGGIPPVVLAQADLIEQGGGVPRIFALADPHTSDEPRQHGGTPITLAPVVGSDKFGYAPDLLRALLAADLDVLHMHGLWLYPSRAAAVWKRKTGRSLVLSGHGMLSPWLMARGRLQKAIARTAYLDRNLVRADLLHALTQSEVDDYARESGRGDAVVIPNPGPPPAKPRMAMPDPMLLFIGRFHDKKNLDALIAGWAMARRMDAARLVIAGFGGGTETQRLRAAAAATTGVTILDAVFGEDKAALLRSARFVVLPSHSEGLPVALLEAWAHGVPTLQTEECNLPEGFAAKAALPCGIDPVSIARSIEIALAVDGASWLAMSNAARGLASGPFSRATITEQWLWAYARLGGRAEPA